MAIIIFTLAMGMVGGCNSYISDTIVKDAIRVEIINDKILIQKSNPQLEFSIKLYNTTEKGFLMYSFGSMEEAFAEDSVYADDNNTAGNAIFIFDKQGNQITPEISIGGKYHYNPITLDTLQNVHERVREKFISNMVYLKPNSVVEDDLEYTLMNHQLDKGEYEMYLMYYSGKNLSNNVEPTKLREDEEKYNAEVFKGWIKSNVVKLLVE